MRLLKHLAIIGGLAIGVTLSVPGPAAAAGRWDAYTNNFGQSCQIKVEGNLAVSVCQQGGGTVVVALIQSDRDLGVTFVDTLYPNGTYSTHQGAPISSAPPARKTSFTTDNGFRCELDQEDSLAKGVCRNPRNPRGDYFVMVLDIENGTPFAYKLYSNGTFSAGYLPTGNGRS